MTAVTEPPPRILTLDIVRGVAVMGILAMNIVAFAMPPAAYPNPMAYGVESDADLISFGFSFVFIDGKMRGLFSFLFGAGLLLIIERAEAKGENPAAVHYRRMAWLLLFGLLHFYFIWFGDILTGYALAGMIAWFWRRRSPRVLIAWGAGLVLVQLLVMGGLAASAHYLSSAAAAPNPDPEIVRQWAGMQRGIAVPTAAQLHETLALYRGDWLGVVREQLTDHLFDPFIFFFLFAWETLAYMLFGMAALKTGFLTGQWSDSAYRRAVMIGLAAIPAYAVLEWLLFEDGFTVPGLFTFSFAGTVPVRPLMIVAYAALIILLTRRGGALVGRIAAAGRAAFTNYLGTSILMTALFYGWGLGLFGSMSRAELWLPVLAMWLIMLAWSKPWLDRYRYGPFEWLWRSLARGSLQPMKKGR
jgi:uncharacterized protein